jgi:hypothetical protein
LNNSILYVFGHLVSYELSTLVLDNINVHGESGYYDDLDDSKFPYPIVLHHGVSELGHAGIVDHRESDLMKVFVP